MSNIPIDVDAIFNTKGDVKPRLVWLEDENTKELYFYTLHVKYVKQEKYAGIPTILFGCYIERNGCQELIEIRYHKLTTQWVQVE